MNNLIVNMGENVVALIQARMGSTRLPGKVLMKSCNKTLLSHLLERLNYSKLINKIVVATSSDSKDDPIVANCQKEHISFFRGSEKNVLERFTNAAEEYSADFVVRITADCPLINYEIVDYAIKKFIDNYPKYELVTNRFPLTFADGLDVDVIDIESLIKANKNASDEKYKEHIVPYFWEQGRSYFNFSDPHNNFEKYRWTIDYEEDFYVINKIICNLYPKFKNRYKTKEIIEFLSSNINLINHNKKYIKKQIINPNSL